MMGFRLARAEAEKRGMRKRGGAIGKWRLGIKTSKLIFNHE
jgi:hypothetical protein